MGDQPHDAPTLLAPRSVLTDPEATLPSQGTPVAPRRGRLQRGDLLGRYVVLETLGEGGMGVVHLAFDPELERRVAIKLVKAGPQGSSRGSSGHSRLLREAQALAKLSHPNVVTVYDVGTWQESVFVAMEFVDGETVSSWIRRRHAEGEPPWREVLSIFEAAGRGLEAAHARGIVHRDFKPENVMISEDGRVLVLDFGLARNDGADELVAASNVGLPSGVSSVSAALTVTGSVVGTPAYMSPEQYLAQPTDAASDQFSFCISLYYALYGERPFRGETLPELTAAVLAGAVVDPAQGTGVPAWLRRVVLRGLAIEPELRYPSMSELLDQLRRDPVRRRNRLLAGVGALALIGGGLAWGADRLARTEDPCAAATVGAAMDRAWGAEQRAAIDGAFRRDAQEHSEGALEQVTESIDGYATEWVELRRAACRAGRPAGTEASREAALRAACLDQRLQRFEALVRLLGDADQRMVALAPKAVGDLPDPAGCDGDVVSDETMVVPDDPAQQEQVESLRIRLAEAVALRDIGRVQDSIERFRTLLEEARTVGFEPLTAQVLLFTGQAQLDVGEVGAGRERLEDALLLAHTHGLELLAIKALRALVFVNTFYDEQLVLARWQIREMEALARRLGDPPDLVAAVLLSSARLGRKSGDVEESLPDFQRAVELLEGGGDDTDSLIVAYDNLASSLQTLGRHEEASEVLRRAEAIAPAVLGPAHPKRGNLLVHAARIEASRLRPERSVELLEEALGVFEGAYGSHHPNIGAVLNGMGIQLEELGRPRDAVETYRRALEMQLQFFDEQHLQVAVIQQNLGNALRREGRPEEALPLLRSVVETRSRLESALEGEYEGTDNVADTLRALGRHEEAEAGYREAIRLRHEAGDDTAFDLAYPRLGLGLCALGRGELDEAVRAIEAVLHDYEAVPQPDSGTREMLATTRFALAMALGAREPGSSRARALAERARTRWAEAPERYRRELAQVDGWLVDGEIVVPLL